MRNVIGRGGALFGFVLLLGLSPAWAQTGQTFGEIVGRVIDTQSGALGDVIVTLSGPAMIGPRSTTTTERGVYQFPAVPPGTYKLTFELVGFTTFVREALIVPVRTTVTVEVTLKLAAVEESGGRRGRRRQHQHHSEGRW